MTAAAPLATPRYLVVWHGHSAPEPFHAMYPDIQSAADVWCDASTGGVPVWVYHMHGGRYDDVTAECRAITVAWFAMHDRDLPEWLGGEPEHDADERAQRGYDEARELAQERAA